MDERGLPTQLETLEDYNQACENFVLPFFLEQSKKIADIIKSLHSELTKQTLNQETIEYYINSVMETAAFAHEKNSMFPYFQAVVALESKLESQNAFTNEELT